MTVETIAECLHRSVSGDPWHGPSIEALLACVSPAQAAARPIGGAHSILEIVLHMTAWTAEVTSRLAGNQPCLPRMGDWPEPEGDGESAWRAAREDLVARHAALVEAVGDLDPARFREVVGSARDRRLGTGVTVAAMLLGLAQHTAYHGGQIALLTRAIGDPAQGERA